MPRVHRFFDSGFIDILSLVAVVFLVVTAITGAIVVNNKNTNLNIRNKAATTCMDPCFQDSDCATNEYCYRPATGCAICKVKNTPAPTTTLPPTTSPIVTTSPSVTPIPVSAPSCGSLYQACCGQTYPNGTCNAGLYCSSLDNGTCITNICHAERKCHGNVLQICKTDNSGWSNTTCPYGCSPATKDCNLKPSPSPTPIPTAISSTCSGVGRSCLDPHYCCSGLDCNTQNICATPTPTITPTPTPLPTTTPTSAPANTGCSDKYGYWCSNSGDIALTVDHDVTGWSDCLAWCKLNMSTINPLCQYNADSPRNCWVKKPPAGGISACSWTFGMPPFGACYSGNSPVSQASLATTCMDPCTSDADCGTGKYCYIPATGCRVCKPANTVCTPGKKQCSGSYLQVCNSQGIGWLSNDCGSAGCNPNTLSCNFKLYGPTCNNQCTITESCILTDNGYYGCQKNSSLFCVPGHKQCSGSILQTCDTNGTSFLSKDCGTLGCDPTILDCTQKAIISASHFECSLAGDYALHVDDLSLGIDWSKSLRCNLGCKNGACIGGVSTSCQEGQTSLDHFEMCVDSNWRCIPGQTRRLTVPGQSNIPNIVGCDQDYNQYVLSDSAVSLHTLYCDGNNLVDDTKKIITTCPAGESCLTSKDYGFISDAGCYQKTYIDANTCKAGDVKEPQLPGDCKQVCKNNEWAYTNPLECLRDPNVFIWRTCSPDTRSNVMESGKVIEICSNGCSYGQCIPEPKSECNSGDGYLVGSPNQCLVSCVNDHYQNTQICTNTLDIKGAWNTDELLMMFKAINEFPESYSGMIDRVPFERLAQPYINCSGECGSLASGVYENHVLSSALNIPGSITIPDSGTDKNTLDHEIIHAISDMNSQLMSGFIKATGCKQNPADPNGLYIFSEAPYREYGQTNCDEGIAVSCGEEYMDPVLSCTMQTARPNAYKFCKDQVFNGKEYCNPNAQSSIFDKLMKTATNLFSIVYAADASPLATPNSIETKLGILIPGTTNAEDLGSIVGPPTETIQQDGKTILTYASTDISRSHLVYIQNGVVTFVQIVLEKNHQLNLTDITNQYGTPEEKSYSTHSPNAPVYSYPSRGISFLIDGNTNQVFMIQKYIPTTITQFNETFGKNFSNQQYGDTFQEITPIKEQLTAKLGNQQASSTNNLPTILIISSASVIFLISATVLIIRYRVKKRNQNIINSPPIIQT